MCCVLEALVNGDTLLRTRCCPWCFLGCANWETFAAGTKCLWTKSETFLVSATNVARSGKRGNICVSNNVSATMCPRLPGPLGNSPSRDGAWQTTTTTATRTSTKQVLMSKTIAVHVRYKSWYISLPSFAKQQREMTKCCVVYWTWTTTANFWYFHLELKAIGRCRCIICLSTFYWRSEQI